MSRASLQDVRREVASAVTIPPRINVTASPRLVGRSDAGPGHCAEIAIGAGLSMSGATLSATGSGGGGAITLIAQTSPYVI